MMFLNANRAFAAFASLTLTALVMAATIIPASPTLMI
nr:enoyl-CoA hydratase [Porphyrobacter sp. GA68]